MAAKDPKLSERKRFYRFVQELEKLSVKYGVIIQVTGGVNLLDDEDFQTLKKVSYTQDPTSGDLWPEEII